LLFAAACAASMALASRPCVAVTPTRSPEQQAAESFSRGRQLYDAEQFEEALANFRTAVELAPSPNARLYIGRCFRRLGRLAEAYNELRRAAQEADRRATTEPRYAATRETAREEAATLVSSVAFVTLAVVNAPAGAEVTIDGQRTGPALWSTPLARAPGRAHIEARAEGMQRIALDVELTAGCETRVRIPFSPDNLQGAVQIGFNDPAPANNAQGVETVAVDRAALDASMGSRSGSRAESSGSMPPTIEPRPANSAWVSVGGVTVALGLGGVVTGIVFAVLAENRFQSLRMQCSGVGNPCRTDADLQAQINEGRTFDTITTASIIGGAALTAVGMGMVIGGVLQNESIRAEQLQQQRLQNQRHFVLRATPTVSVSAGGAFVGVGGRF
jgi:hypothetical protein